MKLDDGSLRDHLDRRATSGVADLLRIVDTAMHEVAETQRGRWWRGLAMRPAMSGLAAAAVIVLLVALTALPRNDLPGPGASAASSPVDGTDMPAGYPGGRALTLQELDALLGDEPARRAGSTVVADVSLGLRLHITCIGECPRYTLAGERRQLLVYDLGHQPEQIAAGPYALRVREDGGLDLLGAVRAGPDGLAWSLPQLLDELPSLRTADPARLLYLVGAVRAVSSAAYRCLLRPPTTPDFGCGSAAWLVPDEASVPEAFNSAPSGSLRVPNVTAIRLRSDALRQHGYWLVDPFVAVDDCFLCPPAGAADLIARILSIGELGATSSTPAPSPSGSPSPPAIGVREIQLSETVVALDGFETADVALTVRFSGDVIEMLDPRLTPIGCLRRDGGGQPLSSEIGDLAATLTRVPGTSDAWSATFRLTSSQAGTWRVGCVVAYTSQRDKLDIDAAALGLSPVLTVVGTNRPQLTLQFDPQPVDVGQRLQAIGQVANELGSALAGVDLTIGRATVCIDGGSGDTVTSDTTGRYEYTIDQATASEVCVWITDPPGIYPAPWIFDRPIAIHGWIVAIPNVR